ncbi:MAG: hypothetical protein HOL70_01360 [Candidatus Marinimicrobia bacterium]|nr:hypothetical protein [Candidatus Neomarinimicrobiota bacterium]
MIEPKNLVVGNRYIGATGNIFLHFRAYGPNIACFKREHDGMKHFGREFIEFDHGKIMLKIEILPEDKICLICKDDYGDIAEECFIAGVCPDCMDSNSSEELIESAMRL